MQRSSILERLSAITPRQFSIALALVIVVVSLQYTIKIVDVRNGRQDRSAILRWREQLLQLDSGENIYQKFTYPNPPIMALMLRPLADLPPIAGALTWYYLKVVLTVLAFAAIIRIVSSASEPFPPWAIGLAVLLSLRPVIGDLTHGNVNLLIMFLVVVSVFAFRSGWDISAGVVLALAIACKVTPALFVAYYLWKRAWRTLIGCAVGLVLFFLVIPGLSLGWSENWEYLTSWGQNMVLPYVVGGVVTSDHPNQSLPGVIYRLFTESPAFSTYINDVYTPVEYLNWLSLSPRAASWLVKLCMAFFVGVVALTCRTPLSARRDWRLAAEASIVIVGMLLFSERTWKHHCVTLALPFAVLSHRLAYAPEHRRRIMAVLAASLALMTTTGSGLWSERWSDLALAYGAYVGAFLVLFAGLAAELRVGRTAPAIAPLAVAAAA